MSHSNREAFLNRGEWHNRRLCVSIYGSGSQTKLMKDDKPFNNSTELKRSHLSERKVFNHFEKSQQDFISEIFLFSPYLFELNLLKTFSMWSRVALRHSTIFLEVVDWALPLKMKETHFFCLFSGSVHYSRQIYKKLTRNHFLFLYLYCSSWQSHILVMSKASCHADLSTV